MRWVVKATLRPLFPGKRPGTQFTVDWVGPRASLDGCGKSRNRRDSTSGPSILYRVAILTYRRLKERKYRSTPMECLYLGNRHVVSCCLFGLKLHMP